MSKYKSAVESKQLKYPYLWRARTMTPSIAMSMKVITSGARTMTPSIAMSMKVITSGIRIQWHPHTMAFAYLWHPHTMASAYNGIRIQWHPHTMASAYNGIRIPLASAYNDPGHWDDHEDYYLWHPHTMTPGIAMSTKVITSGIRIQ